VSRRVRIPTADDLFRPTVVPDPDSDQDPDTGPSDRAENAAPPAVAARVEPASRAARGPSGRVKHDEKMTVYVTADELLDIEHARLSLRRIGLTVDRGRLVREAVALVLADLEDNGDDSALVRRLLQQ
jgi:hypothetical protein